MKPDKLKLRSNSPRIQHATVGFDQIDPEIITQTTKVVSEAFGFESRIAREVGDRIVYNFTKADGWTIEHLASAMKKIRSAPSVDFVDLWIADGDYFHVLECDDPKIVSAVSHG